MSVDVKQFTDPRLRAEFDDWPSGRHRVKCRFYAETTSRGTRVCRQTQDKAGKWCAPKATTYAGPAAIVTGPDGRTYILRLTHYGFIDVVGHDLMKAAEPVFQKDDGYQFLLSLIDQAKGTVCA